MKHYLLSKILIYNLISSIFFLFTTNELLAEDKSERKEIISLINLGIKHWRKHSHDSAYMYLLDSERRSIQIKDTQLIVVSLNNMGMLETSRANYENGIDYFQKSLKYNSNKNNSKLNTFLNLSMTYRKLGDYKSALSYLHKTKDIAVILRRKKELASCYNEFGIIKKLQGNYEEALYYYHKSLHIAKELDSKKRIVIALNNIGNVYKEQLDFSKALLYFTEALSLKIELGNRKYLASAYFNVGEVQMKLKDFINAENSLQKALIYSQNANDEELEITSCFLLGEMFASKNNYLQSKLFLERAKNKAELINSLDLQKETYLRLKNLYAAQKKGQKALYYYDKYIAVKDSIFNTESMKHMQEMETRYQTREKEQQIKLLHLENSNQELLLQRTRLGNWLLAGFALLLLLSILPVYYFIKQKQNYRLLQERSMAENKECNRISRELHDGVVSNLSYLCRWGEDEQVDGHFIQKLRKVSDEIRGISHQLNVNAIGKLAFRESLIDSLDLEHFPKDIDLKIYLLDDFEVVKYDEKMNWIRIIKELLNNSLKYADASIIQIQFLQNGKSIHFQYQDNGKGVDLQKIKPGNGMQNIEDRVKLLGGKLEMKSEIGGGFECVITV